MGQHTKTNRPGAYAKAIAEAADRIGDGSQLQPEDFGVLDYAERVALHQANPAQYDALREGRTVGSAWRPAAGKAGKR